MSKMPVEQLVACEDSIKQVQQHLLGEMTPADGLPITPEAYRRLYKQFMVLDESLMITQELLMKARSDDIVVDPDGRVWVKR